MNWTEMRAKLGLPEDTPEPNIVPILDPDDCESGVWQAEWRIGTRYLELEVGNLGDKSPVLWLLAEEDVILAGVYELHELQNTRFLANWVTGAKE